MVLCTCLTLKNENNAYCNQSAFVLPFNKKETLDNRVKHKITISISIRIEKTQLNEKTKAKKQNNHLCYKKNVLL